MADLTNIEWCDATLNLWHGCTKVSEGCKFCYANAQSVRYGKNEWGPSGTRTEIKSWRTTLSKISKRAKEEGKRLRVFCQSMSDTFEGPDTCGGEDSPNWTLIKSLQLQLFNAIWAHPELDFLILTKRPENIQSAIMRARLNTIDQVLYEDLLYPWSCGTPPPNVWLGTSIEDQKTADERIPHLLKVPAAVRFLSCEPLLGPVDLVEVGADQFGHGAVFALTGQAWIFCGPDEGGQAMFELGDEPGPEIHWVIAGGESGPNARPMHPDWARSLRDQCQSAGVAFHFKQWGEWGEPSSIEDSGNMPIGYCETHACDGGKPCKEWPAPSVNGIELLSLRPTVYRVGKKAAGRLLDGRTWDEYPEVSKALASETDGGLN